MKRRIAKAWWAFLVLSTAIVTAQRYTITDLGTLKGDDESSGFWINNNGDVVGCSDRQTSEGYPCTGLVAGQRAFYWSASSGMKNLGALSGASVSGAIGVNDSGTVVGYSNVKGQPSTNFIAVEWSSTGAITKLGTLWGGSSSAAFSINSSGEASGDSFLASGKVNATNWTNEKIKNLGALKGAIFTAGLGINDNGQVVGESVLGYGPPFTSHGFLWHDSDMTDLGTLNGGVTSMANGINSSGVIVGQSDGGSNSGHWHAVKWDTNRKIKDLGILKGGTYSVAFAINDSDVVVGYANTSTNAAHAIVWTSSEGMQDLNALIPADSGWTLINANAINNIGQITGYGSKSGHNHAFVLTPSP